MSLILPVTLIVHPRSRNSKDDCRCSIMCLITPSLTWVSYKSSSLILLHRFTNLRTCSLSTFVEHQKLLESSGSMGHFLCVLPLWVNGSTQGLFTLGPLTVLHKVGPLSRSSQKCLWKITVTLCNDIKELTI